MNWISVKERLPENGDTVLVFDNGSIDLGHLPDIVERAILKATYEYQDDLPINTFDCGNWMSPSFTVTHWMPLPESPKS